MTDPFDLQRFVTAQAPVFQIALAELRAGTKRSRVASVICLPVSDPKRLVEIAQAGMEAALQKRLVDGARKLSARWRELAPVAHSTVLRGLVSRQSRR